MTHPQVGSPTSTSPGLFSVERFTGEIVVDPFCGSGTTCVAAKRMGRRWIGIDCVKSYAAVARANIERAEADGGVDLRIGTHWRPRG